MRRETDDDDGQETVESETKKKKKCSPICKNTRLSLLRRKRL